MGTKAVLAGAALLVTTACGAPAASSDVTTRSAAMVATGRGWTSSGVEGPIPPPDSCHFRRSREGYALPDPACTPGAVDTSVTQANLGDTICRSGGYTTSVRPPVSVSGPTKRAVLRAYGIPASDAANYELDHLVELGAGGSSDVRNLWPEPNNDAGRYQRNQYVHNDKDELESRAHTAICDGHVTLSRVQTTLATNWPATASLPGVS